MARTKRRLTAAERSVSVDHPKRYRPTPESPHIGLTTHCGICGTDMVVGENCTALLGTNHATEFLRCIEPFAYPSIFLPGYGHNVRKLEDGTPLCIQAECAKGTALLEACTVHIDCLALFQRSCMPGKAEAWERLWVAAAWRRPWPQVFPLGLKDSENPLSTAAIRAAIGGGENDSLSRLALGLDSLPPEIVQEIRSQSMSSLFWRYATVLDVAHRMASRATLERLSSMPLSRIAAWRRGTFPDATAATSAAHLPFVRLTIDARGLLEIERLPGRPSPSGTRWSRNLSFVLLHEAMIQDAILHFKFGHARLELPMEMKGLQTWDTPVPPSLTACHLHRRAITPNTRFHTIPLERADGITIFFKYSTPIALHIHTPSTPIAIPTHFELYPYKTVWVYVPFAAHDRVLAFGTRSTKPPRGFPDDDDDYIEFDKRGFCFIFRTQLVGDISVGSLLKGPFEDDHLASAPPVTIVYSTSDEESMSVLGAYATSPLVDDPKAITPFGALPRRVPTRADDYMWLVSSAPLDHVAQLRIFSDRDFGFTRGILLTYENGGQRTLGQCRIGVDPASDYERPVCLCVLLGGFTYTVENPAPRQPGTEHWQVMWATAATSHAHDHDQERWTCHALRGHLEYCFTHRDSELAFFDDT